MSAPPARHSSRPSKNSKRTQSQHTRRKSKPSSFRELFLHTESTPPNSIFRRYGNILVNDLIAWSINETGLVGRWPLRWDNGAPGGIFSEPSLLNPRPTPFCWLVPRRRFWLWFYQAEPPGLFADCPMHNFAKYVLSPQTQH
jgi:hypothetical protein